MKNIFRIIMIMALVPVLTGCFDEPGTDVTLDAVFVSAATGSYELNEGARDTILIEVSRAQSSDLVIDYTISDNNTENGVDYNITGTSVTIPAGEFSVEVPFEIVQNTTVDPSRSFTVSFSTSVDLDGNSEVLVSLIDDDCAIDADAIATGIALEDYFDGDPYGPYDPGASVTGTNEITWSNFWDSGWEVVGTFDPVNLTVTISGSNQSLAGANDWTITGSGTVDTCNDQLVIDATVSSASFPFSSNFDWHVCWKAVEDDCFSSVSGA